MDTELTRALIGAGVGGGAFVVYSALVGRPNANFPPKASGVASPGFWYCVLSASLMAALGIALLGHWLPFKSDVPYWLGVLSCLAALSSLSGLAPAHDVIWDERGVWGPAGWWTMPFRRRKRFLAWQDITEVTIDMMGNKCLKSDVGKTIRWNATYANHRVFMSSIKSYRPDLFRAKR
jgi:hypothetical protein